MSPNRFGAIATAAMALVLTVGSVAALAAPRTTITLTSVGPETFTATGGVICPSGTATTEFGHFGGGPSAGSFHLTKTLVCDDGSGSFTISINAATVFGSPSDQGGWSVQSGTGTYATLSGGGNVVGTYVAGGIVDSYTGALHL